MSTGHYDDPDLYDWMYQDDRGDVDFYLDIAIRDTGQDRAVVDIGAGTGRIALEVARRGREVYCLDSSIQMCKRLEEILRYRHDVRCAGIEKVDVAFPRDEFPTVIAPFHVLNHVTGRGLSQTFKRMANMMRSGGLLAFDLLPLPKVFREGAIYAESMLPSARCHRYLGTHRYQRAFGVIHHHLTGIGPAGQAINQDYSQRIYEPDEVLTLAKTAGLELVSLHGGFHGEVLTPDSPEHVYVFRRA